MLVTSRSYPEYVAMFDLPDDLPGPVLDCCAGGSGFVAAAAARGTDAVAADPAYELGADELAEVVRRGTADGGAIVDDHRDRFVWSWYGDRARRDTLRARAGRDFIADRAGHPERYVAASLPDLPFADGRFELVLCSHLLFTWADRFDEAWHLAALRELVRVSGGEVRVFPLVLQGAGDAVPFLDDVRRALAAAGSPSEIRRVPYEFQRGADRMLVVDARWNPRDQRR